jgi:hypothetical protein
MCIEYFSRQHVNELSDEDLLTTFESLSVQLKSIKEDRQRCYNALVTADTNLRGKGTAENLVAFAKVANDYYAVSLLADVIDTNIIRCQEEYVKRQNPSYAGLGSLSTFSQFVKNTLQGGAED